MRSPVVLLVALLAAAAIVGLGGVRLARHEDQDRTPANRVALRELAVEWQAETADLKEQYEGGLQRAAMEASTNERPWALREGCRGVAGVVGCARVTPDLNPVRMAERIPMAERIFFERPDSGQSRLPAVWLTDDPKAFDPKDDTAIVLRRSAVVTGLIEDTAGPCGWAETHNRDFGVFWCWLGRCESALLVVDLRTATQRSDEQLRRWMQEPLAKAQAADPFAAVQTGDGAPFAGHAAPDGRAPDVYFLVGNPLGSWQIVSWDRVSTRVEYSKGVLAIALALSASLAALGVFVFRLTKANR